VLFSSHETGRNGGTGRTQVLQPSASEVLAIALDEKQLALVHSAGETILCKGSFELSFFDGISTVTAVHSVAETVLVHKVPLPAELE
jgi:hypothetical protein